jgi:Mrp family chromosome partitioning ATPase
LNTESRSIQRAERPGIGREAMVPARHEPATWSAVAPRRLRWATRMRGRWRWVLLAAVFGAGLGATLGYYSTRPTYRATASVVVKPITFDPASHDAPLVDTRTAADDGSAAGWRLRIITDGVRRQAEALRDAALIKTALGESTPASPIDHLHVAVRPDDLGRLRVSWTDRDAQLAAARLRRVLEAYKQTPRYRAQQDTAERALDQWAAREVALRQWSQTKGELTGLLGADEMADLAAAARAGRARVSQLNEQVQTLRFALAALNEPTDDADGSRLAALRLDDEQRAALQAERERLMSELQNDSANAKVEGEGATASGETAVTPFEALARSLRLAWIDHRLRQAAEAEPRVKVTLRSDGVETEQALTAAQCRARLDELTSLTNTARAEANAAAARLAEARRLANRAEQHRHEAQHAAEVLERLAAEPIRTVARVEPGIDRPRQPYRDHRAAFAAIGAGAGLCLGVGGAILLVLRNDRMRTADEPVLAASEAPLLGALPTLPPERATRADADEAAMSMHQVRARLEALAESHDRRAFAVVSADAGLGKTSVAVGLASSLATAGHRVLLIDGDLSGRSRPAQPDATDHPGLDQVLREMGHLPEHTAELFVADQTRSGLLGALRGLPLEHCVVETRVAGLDALPALGARPEHAGRLSGKAIRRLIGEARSRYDYVLIDSGRIPGGVEALLVAGNADGVLMVVAPTQRQRGFDRALAQLRLVGANVVGTVYNRATQPASRKAGSDRDAEPWRPSDVGGSGSGIFAAAIDTQTRDLPDLARVSRPRSPRPRVQPTALPPAQTEPTTDEADDAPTVSPADIAEAARTATPTDQTPTDPAIPEPDTESHRVLGDTVDRLVQDTIALAMRQRRLRDRVRAEDAPASDAADVGDDAGLDSEDTPQASSADAPPAAGDAAEDDSTQLARDIDSMLESARDRDA